jgi:hypothetical protein
MSYQTPLFLTPPWTPFPRFPGSVEILFCLYSFILCGSLENDPLSPPEGEAAQGEHPLDPLFFRDIFQPYQELSQQGGCPSGGGGSMKRWSHQERLFVSMRISTESVSGIFSLYIFLIKDPGKCSFSRYSALKNKIRDLLFPCS